MNAQETAAVLAYFAAAWPTFANTEETVEVWMAELDDIDPADAADAMRDVVRTSDFPPSIAKYRSACQNIALRRRQNRTPALGGGKPEWPAELVESLKKLTVNAGNRRHWHGGPNPCEVCGGMEQPKKEPA